MLVARAVLTNLQVYVRARVGLNALLMCRLLVDGKRIMECQQLLQVYTSMRAISSD